MVVKGLVDRSGSVRFTAKIFIIRPFVEVKLRLYFNNSDSGRITYLEHQKMQHFRR